MELSFNTAKIAELGDTIITFLHENGIDTKSELILNVTKGTLRKIDEDLYYRQNPDGQDFVPSDKELTVNFDRLDIVIRAADE